MPSAAQNRRKETRRQQRIAARAGTVSPRWLARSVAKHALRSSGSPENEIKGWRQIFNEFQREQKKRIINRRVQRVDDGRALAP